MFLFNIKFIFTISHFDSLTYQKFFRKYTQSGFFLQTSKRRVIRHRHGTFPIHTVNDSKPLSQHAIVSIVFALQKFRDFDKRKRLLLVKILVLLIFESDRVQIISRLRESVKHLQADQIQIAQIISLSLHEICNRMLCGIKHEAASKAFVFNMLHLQHNPFQTLSGHYDIRCNALAKRPGLRRIYKVEMLQAIASMKAKDRIQKIYRDRLVFRSAEKHLENVVVINVDILVTFLVFCDTLRDIASLLMRFADVLEHVCVLFSIH